MSPDSNTARVGGWPAAGFALALLAVTLGGAPGSLPSFNGAALASSSADATSDELLQDLERIRRVTKPFHDITAAHAAGYPTAVPRCVESRTGGMGHHYVHPRLLDDRLEVEKPEILVYAPTRDGKLKLAGVEYIVPYSARPPTDTPPRILGQALKPSDSLQLWYLHVWVWEENANGLFADWNPAVKCSP